jgi:hypothetical protein
MLAKELDCNGSKPPTHRNGGRSSSSLLCYCCNDESFLFSHYYLQSARLMVSGYVEGDQEASQEH